MPLASPRLQENVAPDELLVGVYVNVVPLHIVNGPGGLLSVGGALTVIIADPVIPVEQKGALLLVPRTV